MDQYKPVELTREQQIALGTDYAKSPVVREHATRYGVIHRGSVRLCRDLFRTEAEHEEFIEAGLKLKLPG